MENLENKLKQAIDLQNKIEERMKFLEENVDNLTDEQLDELANLAFKIEESLFPEVDKIKQEMEDKKQEIIENAQKPKAQ
jgi:hypothetical protein